jgi:hypothetical protein
MDLFKTMNERNKTMGQDSKKEIARRKVACFKVTGCRFIPSTRLGQMDDAGLTGPRKTRKRQRQVVARIYAGRSVNRTEFQRLSGLTQPTIRAYIAQGLIKTEGTGRGTRIPWSEIVRLQLDKA